MQIWISPSQLAFLYRECPLCTWRHFRKVKRPKADFAEFNMMDAQQKAALPVGTKLHGVGIPGIVRYTGGKVCSRDYGDANHEVHILGNYDLLIELDAGGFADVDLKSGKPKPEKIETYQPQCSAYALALREPDRHQPVDVRASYLLYCWPISTTLIEPSSLVMVWEMQALSVPLDIDGARAMTQEIAAIAISDVPPKAREGCATCEYIRDSALLARTFKAAEAPAQPSA